MDVNRKDSLFVEKVTDPLFDENCYVLHQKESNSALVIDPGFQGSEVLALLDQKGLYCERVLVTHGHPDHIAGIPLLIEKYGCPAAIHPADRFLLDADWSELGLSDNSLNVVCDEDLNPTVSINWQGFNITVLHTPGHTPGSICLYFQSDKILSGDTLFYHGVGRVDLLGGAWDDLVTSVRSILYHLPGKVDVYPGHGEMTTINEEMTNNPFVKA